MVNRVFCYSEEYAKKNGCFVSIKSIILSASIIGILLCFGIVFMAIFSVTNENNSIGLFPILISLFLVFAFSYIIQLSKKMRAKLIGYAIDNEGKIYQATKLNYNGGLYLEGIIAGDLVDKITNNNSNIGANIGGMVGVTSQFYTLNKSTKIMTNPEIIAQIVENGEKISGAKVIEILKTYQYIDKGKYVKVNCDYKLLRGNKILYNKPIKIYKAYNCFNDLINIIINKKN